MTWRRRIGVSLVALGVLLVGVYVVPTIYGAAMARLAMAQFHSETSTARTWNKVRRRAYQRALAAGLPATEAVLRVPRLGIDVPVLEGTAALTLNRGVGHIPGTALPGEPGNVGIAGHRDGFFRPLKEASIGDLIEVQTRSHTDRYIIRKLDVVLPSDTSVLNPSTDSALTLVTCYPFYYVGAAPQRFIVQAALLPASTTPGD